MGIQAFYAYSSAGISIINYDLNSDEELCKPNNDHQLITGLFCTIDNMMKQLTKGGISRLETDNGMAIMHSYFNSGIIIKKTAAFEMDFGKSLLKKYSKKGENYFADKSGENFSSINDFKGLFIDNGDKYDVCIKKDYSLENPIRYLMIYSKSDEKIIKDKKKLNEYYFDKLGNILKRSSGVLLEYSNNSGQCSGEKKDELMSKIKKTFNEYNDCISKDSDHFGAKIIHLNGNTQNEMINDIKSLSDLLKK